MRYLRVNGFARSPPTCRAGQRGPPWFRGAPRLARL